MGSDDRNTKNQTGVDNPLPMYAVLIKFTQKRMETIESYAESTMPAYECAKALGIDVKIGLRTMGQYDVVAIAEAPNDEAMVKWLLAFNRNGYLITETLRGFTYDEFVKMIDEIKDLPK